MIIFINLISFCYLSFVNNKFMNIIEGIFGELRVFIEINMDENLWLCDCDFLWFLDYSFYYGIKFSGGLLCLIFVEYNCKGNC